MEVAWVEIPIWNEMVDLKRLAKELGFLQTLKHPSIVVYVDAWVNEEQMSVVVVTELMKPGTIADYAKKMVPTLGAIKRWLVQILRALLYLHEQNPPVIHRDIKCDNIFINSTTGLVKLGDFGLATTFRGVHKASLVGTSEFLAPEVWNGHYDVKADIWAFGMACLELVTSEYPYSECLTRGQVYSRIRKGFLPLALERLVDDEVKEFILYCLQPDPEDRPTATMLLNHPFLQDIGQDSNNRKVKLLSEDEYTKIVEEAGFTRKRSHSAPPVPTNVLQPTPHGAILQQLELQTLLRRHTRELLDFDREVIQARQELLFKQEKEVCEKEALIERCLMTIERTAFAIEVAKLRQDQALALSSEKTANGKQSSETPSAKGTKEPSSDGSTGQDWLKSIRPSKAANELAVHQPHDVVPALVDTSASMKSDVNRQERDSKALAAEKKSNQEEEGEEESCRP